MAETKKESRRVLWRTILVLGLLIAAALVTLPMLLRVRQAALADQALNEGRAAMDRRDFSAAVVFAEKLVRLTPQSVEAWELLAESAGRKGQPARSMEALDRLADVAPERAGKLGIRLATVWMTQNQIRPTIQALQLVSRASPSAPEPYRLMAQMSGVTAHQREVTRCLLELIKRNAFTRDDLLVLSTRRPIIDDPKQLQAMLLADPSDKTLLLPAATSALVRNQVDVAKLKLVEITTFDPADLDAQAMLGIICAEFFPDEFLDWNARLPAVAEQAGRVWFARGTWLNSQGHSEQAIRCLHESIVREPEELSSHVLLGQVLKSQGKTELGSDFTERGRRLQQIVDLNFRLRQPHADEWIEPMIAELEAVGRLWEAWAWSVVWTQHNSGPAEATARRDRLQSQLNPALPRTDPSRLPGQSVDWQPYALPDWSQVRVRPAQNSPDSDPHRSSIHFEEEAEKRGLDFRYSNTKAQETGHKIFETMGAGVAVLDYDQDGWPDLYFPQGKPLPLDSPDGPSDCLYRNGAGERFRQVTVPAGIHETGYSHGVAAGDFDNDGFPDLYVANLGRNRLFRNNGDGTYSDVTAAAGITQAVWTISCAIADLNGDGLPELFDVNYVQGHDLLTATCLDEHNRPTVCRPTMFEPALDTVLMNLGDGRFQEQQAEAGLDLPRGMGLGLVIADFNDDDRPDLFIANDMTANYLLINQGQGPDQSLRFRDEAFLRGVAVDLNGLAQACMGVACADINRDGAPDLFVTNFAREPDTLYLSQTHGFYEDRTQAAGLRGPTFDPLGFGTQFIDADRDGWYDLVVANGHIDEFVNEPYRMKAQVFQGQASGRFVELFSDTAGPLFQEARLARGLALLDWNRDGLTDFVMTDLERPITLATNTTAAPGHSLCLQLVGTQSNRDAIGAKIHVVVADGDERFSQVTAGDGYESTNERCVEIGLGQADRVKSVEIRWPSGTKSHFADVAAERIWLAIEGAASLIKRGSR